MTMKLDLGDFTSAPLIIHIAYGAILSASMPWIPHLVKKPDSNIDLNSFIMGLSLVILFISSWITSSTVLLKRYPYFSGYQHSFKNICIDMTRIVVEFLAIMFLGIALYLSTQNVQYSVNAFLKVNPILFIFLFYLDTTIWNVLTFFIFGWKKANNEAPDKSEMPISLPKLDKALMCTKVFLAIVIVIVSGTHYFKETKPSGALFVLFFLKILADVSYASTYVANTYNSSRSSIIQMP